MPNQSSARFYVLRNFHLKQGSQLDRLHAFLREAFVPAMTATRRKTMVLEAVVAAHMPQVAVLIAMDSVADWQKLGLAGGELAKFMELWNAWEAGDEAPYERYSETLLAPTAYSPDLVEAAPHAPARVVEMRVYHSPTWRQLRALHERFAGPEIPLFHKAGVDPMVYLETMAGPNMPNLTYFIPFSGLAEREKAWSNFQSDPEWHRVRKESIDANGQISSVMSMSLWRTAPYSPVR